MNRRDMGINVTHALIGSVQSLSSVKGEISEVHSVSAAAN
jgi:hypothetical protein